MRKAPYLLIDISNTFTKVALSSAGRVHTVRRIATAELTPSRLRTAVADWSFTRVAVGSVVPSRNPAVSSALRQPTLWVDADTHLGIGVDYPQPKRIGADRLANAVACAELYKTPAVVVDFGTTVTFDVLSADGDYIGGVIAPGMTVFSEYLHQRTALLPRIALHEPLSVLGKSSEEAMRIGAVIGYRGLIREIISQIRRKLFPRRRALFVIATGGDAKLIGRRLPLFNTIDQKLTLEGLRLIAVRNFADKKDG